jgi:acyl-CoA reductase-like NAD-dependent aldehyde dehydrogenase
VIEEQQGSIQSRDHSYLDRHHCLLIDGKWVHSARHAPLDVINPATADVLCTITDAGQNETDLAVAAARYTQSGLGRENGRDGYPWHGAR